MKILELKNVTFATNKHYNSLQDINFELKKGEKALLFSGFDSGAVEFFRVVLGFEKNFKGEIKYNGIDIKKLKYKQSRILYIPKEPIFFENKSIEYNIKYFLKLREKNKSKIQESCEKILEQYSFYDSRDEKVCKLNKFQRLKLCFARSALREIDLILIEDIFGNLSLKELEEISISVKHFIEEHSSASIVWVSNEQLIEVFNNFKKYKLEYGSFDAMP